MTDTAPETPRGFDPSRYLTKVKGNDYLEVKWRIVWLRDRFPESSIETDLVSHTGNEAIFRAKIVVLDADGVLHGSATGWGSCNVSGFDAYVEKAETKAIGRALAALGFGTQFAPELDEGEAIADSPVNRSNQRQDEPQQFNTIRQATTTQRSGNGGATEKQIGAIYGISKGLGWSKTELVEWLQADVDALSMADASTIIGDLNKLKDQKA